MTVYLVVDANALPIKGNIGSGFWMSVLRLCQVKGIRPAMSEVVLDESVNIRRVAAVEVIDQLLTAHSALSNFVELAPIYAPSSEVIAHNYEVMLRERFEILPLEGAHAVEAFRREARRLPPASGGRGGRDSAIWLTISSLLHGGHEVLFVSNNSDDFGKGAILPELLAEIEGAEDRLHYYPDANAFVESIATRITQPEVTADDLIVSFGESIRTTLVAMLREGLDDQTRFESVLSDPFEVTEIRVGQAFEVDGLGLARLTATFEFGYVGGDFAGWMIFDPRTGAPQVSEVDGLTGLSVG